MEITERLEVSNPKKLREWFRKNGDKKKEIWIIYQKKKSGKKGITYQEALEEALCFGWIDSTVKKLDESKYAQRFTPRRKGSSISEMNKHRVRELIKKRKMLKAGMNALREEDVKDIKNPHKLVIKKDIQKALKKDKEVWDNFKNFPDYYQKIRIAYIESQRERPELFKKALNNLIKKTKENKQFGMIW